MDFSQRYLQLMKSASPERITARRELVKEVAGKLTKEIILSLVAVIRGIQDSSSDTAKAALQREVPGEVGSSYPAVLELQFLAEEIALEAFSRESNSVTDFLALCLITSDFCRMTKVLRRQDTLLRGSQYLIKRQKQERIFQSKLVLDAPKSTSVTLSPETPITTYAQLEPILANLRSDVTSADQNISRQYADRLKGIEEQLAVMDLYFVRFSPSAETYYDSIGPHAAFIAAKDLADATLILPGLHSAQRFLSLILTEKSEEECDIFEDFKEFEYLDSTGFLSRNDAIIATPLLWLLSEKNAAESPRNAVITKKLGIEWRSLKKIELAVQIYLEHLAIRVGVSG